MSIFDHINNLTYKKVPWEKLNESEKKSFSPYMTDRIFSMNSDLLPIVNFLQRYTVGELTPEFVYKLYYHLMPKKKIYTKYIKGATKEKYKKELVEIMKKYYQLASYEVIDYLDILMDENPNEVINIITKYGYTKKEAKKLL